MSKSKLDRAVEERASGLNDAQREIALSQFSVYKRNLAMLQAVDDEIAAARLAKPPDSTRAVLAYEREKLSESSNRTAGKLFELMG